MSDNAQLTGLCDRFRGFYPVVIDVETAGFNAKTDALLEIAAITLKHHITFPRRTICRRKFATRSPRLQRH